MKITELIGKSEKEVVDALTAAKAVWRIKQRDNQRFVGTMDYRPNRYNLSITDGKVTTITNG